MSATDRKDQRAGFFHGVRLLKMLTDNPSAPFPPLHLYQCRSAAGSEQWVTLASAEARPTAVFFFAPFYFFFFSFFSLFSLSFLAGDDHQRVENHMNTVSSVCACVLLLFIIYFYYG